MLYLPSTLPILYLVIQAIDTESPAAPRLLRIMPHLPNQAGVAGLSVPKISLTHDSSDHELHDACFLENLK